MTEIAVYRSWRNLFRLARLACVAIAVTGAVIGFIPSGSARIVTWSVFGIVTIFLYTACSLRQHHYQRLLDAAISAKPEGTITAGPLSLRTYLNRELDPAVQRRVVASSTRSVIVVLTVTAIALVVAGVMLSSVVRVMVMAALAGGGLWLASVFLLIRQRVQAIPAAESASSPPR